MVKKTMVYGPHTARTCHKTNQQIKFPTNIRKIQTQDQHGLKMGIDERSIETLIKSAIQERSFHSGWIDGGIRCALNSTGFYRLGVFSSLVRVNLPAAVQ